jgi:UDP-N-acetylmuramate dehydrogenase
MFEIKENISLKNYNTFGIDAESRYFVECSSVNEILDFIETHKKQDLPLMILGGGSNVLFTKNFNGYILRPSVKGIEIMEETIDHVILRVGAGEDWDEFVGYCVDNNWGGIENLSLIPGNVGTCPIQNIGAYGVEVKDIIVEVETIDIKNLKISLFQNSDCKFAYRDSIFKTKLKGKQIITYVSFKLKKQSEYKLDYGNLIDELKRFDEVNLKNIRQAIIDIRNSKLPKPEEIGNAGSFFKNPVVSKEKFKKLEALYPEIPHYKQSDGSVKIPAGWLIEKAGWKGKRVGNTGVHEKQALVIVNYGNATGEEIIHLARNIQQAIIIKFDLELEMEVNVV